MVHFVGAGSGAVDLITIRGAKLLADADVVIYAGSLVNPDLLHYCIEGCEFHDSAKMTLEQVIAVIKEAAAPQKELTPGQTSYSIPSLMSSSNCSRTAP